MTPELLHIATFWAVVVLAIRLAVCFPQSLLARILFSRHGPVRARHESQADYFLRCARFAGSWSMQAGFLFIVGWAVVQWDASLLDSLYFLVLWAVVVPAVGSVALLAALFATGRWLCVWRADRENSRAGPSRAGHA